MKTFAQLTKAQQSAAIDSAVNRLLSAICEGAIRFNDELNCDDLQARIDAALVRADEMQTPWFSGEYVMDTCADDIRGMATCDAEDALYLEPGETAVPEPVPAPTKKNRYKYQVSHVADTV